MPADQLRSAVLLLPDCTPAGALAAALEDEDVPADALFRVAGEFAAVVKKLQRAGELLRKSAAKVRIEGGESRVSGDDQAVGRLVGERLAVEVTE